MSGGARETPRETGVCPAAPALDGCGEDIGAPATADHGAAPVTDRSAGQAAAPAAADQAEAPAGDGAAAPASGPDSRPPARRAWILPAIIALLVAMTGISWAVSSPVGASPDDDYHLGAIWCPPPVDSTGCRITTIDGKKAVGVPQSLEKKNVTCYAFDHDNSAACTLAFSDEAPGATLRWDDGNYPWGYYQFQHLLVGSDTARSVLAMRLVNTMIALALMGAILLLADAALRLSLGVALVTGWVPMGLYFVTSLNPSSWAMTGTLAFTAGLLGASRSSGWRRWGLDACAAAGAVLACTSRGDSAFYMLVCTVALAFAVPWSRSLVREAALAVVASGAGTWIMAHTKVAGLNLAGEVENNGLSTLSIAWMNIKALPDYLKGFTGHGIGPGWNDVSYGGTVERLAGLVVVVVLVVGAWRMSWRRFLSTGAVMGAICGVPVVIGVRGHFSNVEFYQPRYMLPLFAVAVLLWITPARADGGRVPAAGGRAGLPPDHLHCDPITPAAGARGADEAGAAAAGSPSPARAAGGGGTQRTRFGGRLDDWFDRVVRFGAPVAAAVVAFTHSYALYLVLERYTMGRTPHTMPFDLGMQNLNAVHEWWWPWAPIGPMTMWAIGALAFTGALACAMWGALRRSRGARA
ncbi:DUF2142 domain-containing protein [Schaalia georgiae]|nr:DUF2142 domain-containing protein [Schaalia georgiae]